MVPLPRRFPFLPPTSITPARRSPTPRIASDADYPARIAKNTPENRCVSSQIPFLHALGSELIESVFKRGATDYLPPVRLVPLISFLVTWQSAPGAANFPSGLALRASSGSANCNPWLQDGRPGFVR